MGGRREAGAGGQGKGVVGEETRSGGKGRRGSRGWGWGRVREGGRGGCRYRRGRHTGLACAVGNVEEEIRTGTGLAMRLVTNDRSVWLHRRLHTGICCARAASLLTKRWPFRLVGENKSPSRRDSLGAPANLTPTPLRRQSFTSAKTHEPEGSQHANLHRTLTQPCAPCPAPDSPVQPAASPFPPPPRRRYPPTAPPRGATAPTGTTATTAASCHDCWHGKPGRAIKFCGTVSGAARLHFWCRQAASVSVPPGGLSFGAARRPRFWCRQASSVWVPPGGRPFCLY